MTPAKKSAPAAPQKKAVPMFRIWFTDGRDELVKAGPKQIVELERYWGISIEEISTGEHVYYLAWRGAVAAKLCPEEDFDGFLDSIDDAKEVGAEVVDPTQSALKLADSSG